MTKKEAAEYLINRYAKFLNWQVFYFYSSHHIKKSLRCNSFSWAPVTLHAEINQQYFDQECSDWREVVGKYSFLYGIVIFGEKNILIHFNTNYFCQQFINEHSIEVYDKTNIKLMKKELRKWKAKHPMTAFLTKDLGELRKKCIESDTTLIKLIQLKEWLSFLKAPLNEAEWEIQLNVLLKRIALWGTIIGIIGATFSIVLGLKSILILIVSVL